MIKNYNSKELSDFISQAAYMSSARKQLTQKYGKTKYESYIQDLITEGVRKAVFNKYYDYLTNHLNEHKIVKVELFLKYKFIKKHKVISKDFFSLLGHHASHEASIDLILRVGLFSAEIPGYSRGHPKGIYWGKTLVDTNFGNLSSYELASKFIELVSKKNFKAGLIDNIENIIDKAKDYKLKEPPLVRRWKIYTKIMVTGKKRKLLEKIHKKIEAKKAKPIS